MVNNDSIKKYSKEIVFFIDDCIYLNNLIYF